MSSRAKDPFEARTEYRLPKGAALSGLIAARELVSGKVADLLTHKRDEIVIVPSEDISSWPASLRRKMAPRTEEQHASP